MKILKKGNVIPAFIGQCLQCAAIMREERDRLEVRDGSTSSDNTPFAWSNCAACGFRVCFKPAGSVEGLAMLAQVEEENNG